MAEDLAPHVAIQTRIVAHQVSQGRPNVSTLDPAHSGNIGITLDHLPVVLLWELLWTRVELAIQPCHIAKKAYQ